MIIWNFVVFAFWDNKNDIASIIKSYEDESDEERELKNKKYVTIHVCELDGSKNAVFDDSFGGRMNWEPCNFLVKK